MLSVKKTAFRLCNFVSKLCLPRCIRKMACRVFLTFFNGRRRIAVLLGVCLTLTVTFILNNFDISMSSRHVITFQANLTHSVNEHGGHRTNVLTGTHVRDCNVTTQSGIVNKNINSIPNGRARTGPVSEITFRPNLQHNSIVNTLEYIKNYNKLNHRSRSKANLNQQQLILDTPLGYLTYEQRPALPRQERVVHNLQPPNIWTAFTTTPTDLLNTKHLSGSNRPKLVSDLQFQRRIPSIAVDNTEVNRNSKIVSNDLINSKLFNRLKQIQHINMQNHEALAYNSVILHDQLVDDNFDTPEQDSVTTLTEERDNEVINKRSRPHEFTYLPEQIHGVLTNGAYVGDNSVPVRHIPSRSIQQPVHVSRDRTKTPSFCRKPREVWKVENILCMEKPKFLPNYKNPCWRDSPTRALRCLPYFHIFGTCKSGTTDLFHRMIHHPHIIPNKGILSKETWFWSWKRYDRQIGVRRNVTISDQTMTLKNFTDFFNAKKIEKYVTHVDGHSPYHNLITGHGDPMDIWDFTRWRKISQNNPRAQEPEVTTPHLVHHMNPDIKLIALLREPAERTYSHFLHTQSGDTKEAFHFHVVKAINYLTDCENKGQLRACVYRPGYRIKAPLHASLYYLHLTEWLKVFPRNQMLLLTTDDYHNDTAGTLRTVFRHLNLDPMPHSELIEVASRQKQYVSPLKAKLGAMLPQTKALLGKYFENSIHKLASLLNDTKYLKWIDSSASHLDVYRTNEKPRKVQLGDTGRSRKRSHELFFNARNDVGLHTNRNPRGTLILNKIHGVKLPSNNIPIASNILPDFIFHSNTQPNVSSLSNSIPSVKVSSNILPPVELPSNSIYEVKLPSKNIHNAKLGMQIEAVPALNTIMNVKSSSKTLPATELNSNIVQDISLPTNVQTKNVLTSNIIPGVKLHSRTIPRVKFSPKTQPSNILNIPIDSHNELS